MQDIRLLADWLAEIHSAPPDWRALISFYSGAAAVVLFIVLQILMIRGRRLAVKAFTTARGLMEDMRGLQEQMSELERRLEKRLDARTGDLDARMTKKIDQKGDLIEQRVDGNRAGLTETIAKLDGRMADATEQVERFHRRLDEVESRIPGLFDRLDEFRDTLAKTFQAELSGVLNSFDTSVAGILQQMKSELQLGITRIESIESMVRSRERAESTLLGGSKGPALPEALDGEGPDFEEWEREAKELAQEGGEDDALDEVVAIAAEANEREAEDHPGEMADAPADDLETDLYPEESDEDPGPA